MKIILTFCLIISSAVIALSQEQFNIKWEKDTVYNNDRALFICKEKVQENLRMYTMRNFKNKQLVILFFEDKDTVSKGSATFPSIAMSYKIYCPKAEVSAWLDIYIRNGIIKEGEVDSIALKEYCSARLIPLMSLAHRQVKRPLGVKDSVVPPPPPVKQEPISTTNLILSNHSSTPVNISIGTPEKNKSQIILPGAKMDMQVKEGESVCLLDKNKKSIKCREFKKGANKVIINKSGSGFE